MSSKTGGNVAAKYPAEVHMRTADILKPLQGDRMKSVTEYGRSMSIKLISWLNLDKGRSKSISQTCRLTVSITH